MREIKFRVWDKSWGKMLYFGLDDANALADYDDYFGGFVTEEREGSYQDIYAHDLPDDYLSENEKYCLMQYTGLKDKVGHEIYEGDIVKFPREVDYNKGKYETVNWLVRWSNTEALFELVHGQETGLLDIACNTEVIGNIYENPRLLTFASQK